MNQRYVYIDETGDLGETGSKYFVITAIWTDQPELLDRLIKNIRRNKFKKQLKDVHEIKANKSRPELRMYILKKLSEIERLRAQSIILKKDNVFSEYLKNDKNKLYNYVCGILVSNMSIDSKNLVIRIDRSKGKQALRDDFDQYVTKKFTEARWNRKIEIYHSWSHSWSGLQLVDFVSWAVFHKFESGNDEYFKIIESKTNINHVWEQ
jgi:hypothetical protein